MNRAPQEAMILLYPSGKYDSREMRTSLNQFCQSGNMSVIDVITFSSLYDYLAARRLYHIIKYSTKSIALVSNRKLSSAMHFTALLTLLDVIGSDKALDMTLGLLQKFEDKACGSGGDFYIMPPEEVRFMSEWMGDVKYEIVRGRKQGAEASRGFI